MGMLLGFASDSPTAVITFAYSGRLSRMLTWDTSRDEFSPSTWLKGALGLHDVSADGEYAAYEVIAHHRQPGSYLAVCRPPYLTALFFWPVSYNGWRDVSFSNGDLRVLGIARDSSHWGGRDEWREPRITEGCPFNIVYVPWSEVEGDHNGYGPFEGERVERERARKGYAIARARYGSIIDANETWSNRVDLILSLFPEARELVEAEELKRLSWDNSGRPILWNWQGKIARVTDERPEGYILADLTGREFEERQPPEWARSWTLLRDPA